MDGVVGGEQVLPTRLLQGAPQSDLMERESECITVLMVVDCSVVLVQCTSCQPLSDLNC